MDTGKTEKTVRSRRFLRRPWLAAVLLLAALYVAGLAVCCSLGTGRLRDGDPFAAEKLLAFPAKNGFGNSKAYHDMCRQYNGRHEIGLFHAYYRIRDYQGSKYPDAVRREAGKLLTLVGNESYAQGLEEYREGRYADARGSFSIATGCNVQGARAWELLCEAFVLSADNKYADAFSTLAQAKLYAPSSDLKAECDAAKETMETRKAAWEPRYLEVLKNAVPREGMEEQYVMLTMIGLNYPYQIKEFDYKTKGGSYRVYHFYQDSDEIYSVMCEGGKVTYVKDLRDEVAKKNAAAAKSKKSSGSGKKQDGDTSYASDYPHPEDFYDWYIDDFWDYEDAEDYWEEHN